MITTTTTTESTTTTPPPTTTTTTTTPEPAPVAEHELPVVEGSTRWMEYPSDESQAGGHGNTNAQFLGPNLSTLVAVLLWVYLPTLL